MLKLEINLTHQEPNLSFLRQATKDYLRSLKVLGFTVTMAKIGDEFLFGWEAEPAAEMAVDFASSTASELADDLNLTAAAFKGMKPSGVTGYTVGDVRKAAGS